MLNLRFIFFIGSIYILFSHLRFVRSIFMFLAFFIIIWNFLYQLCLFSARQRIWPGFRIYVYTLRSINNISVFSLDLIETAHYCFQTYVSWFNILGSFLSSVFSREAKTSKRDEWVLNARGRRVKRIAYRVASRARLFVEREWYSRLYFRLPRGLFLSDFDRFRMFLSLSRAWFNG